MDILVDQRAEHESENCNLEELRTKHRRTVYGVLLTFQDAASPSTVPSAPESARQRYV